MTDYTNAPTPQGALFDDAPAVQTTYTMHAAAALTPAVRIACDRDGKWFAKDVAMQYGAPLPLELALKRVAIGRTVFVQPGDAAQVMEAVSGADG
jgi:hypothetical protein